MRWFENYRLEWMKEMLEIYGFINREHLMKKFDISLPQTTLDFNKFKERYPDFMVYNVRSKRYEINNGGDYDDN